MHTVAMQTMWSGNPCGLTVTETSPDSYTTGENWEFYDDDHVAEIADSMRAHGWRGAPLVVVPEYGLSYNGTHRLRAAAEAELEVPTVALRDLFAACGLDLDAICDEHDLGLMSDRADIVAHLPEDVREAYTLADIED
ncbi:ParB/Srx family N-terminal domain-containing protein [Streptomyces triticirhizae]|uniref:Uncharacterized protein n=1 Tax=Streptomyces triticirhizae TaxID=2483353 RepID=A0A3M2LT28_9ACTN|nr:ParB/Srx family N-terminal domain-containing protein [Streptomyces triticirhizae]RMI39733.1 hypothetical protein EBN88_14170 [Streptomyces triticirhizae]